MMENKILLTHTKKEMWIPVRRIYDLLQNYSSFGAFIFTDQTEKKITLYSTTRIIRKEIKILVFSYGCSQIYLRPC